MFDAAIKALTQMFSPEFRRVLLKSIGLALLMIILVGIGLNRVFSWLAGAGANWAEADFGGHAAWQVIAWILSFAATLGVITGAVFLMPAVTAFVGSFFVDEIGETVERTHYPAEPPGRALSLMTALIEGIRTALLAVAVYLCALPFLLFAGLGLVIMFLATAWLLSREYFLLAAMRFRPPDEAKAMRRANSTSVMIAGLPIALFVSIPILNLATPLFAMAMMVHVHKRLSGQRVELIAPRRNVDVRR
jgi:CysZ protein